MNNVLKFLSFFAILAASSATAKACMTYAQRDINDVRLADAVVVGEIRKYEIVESVEARKRRAEMRARNPELWKDISEDAGYLSDYARFEIAVTDVLKGEASGVVTVTWDNSTFGEPKTIATGTYLVALRRADSPRPPLRGPSATILAQPEPGLMTVLQAPCSGAFIFAAKPDTIQTIRDILLNGDN